MFRTILLTSFQTWLPQQTSNSSDDLLAQLPKHRDINRYPILLRGLPVDTQQASQRVLSGIQFLQPDAIICCGMAEGRSHLAVESNARCGNRKLQPIVNLKTLTADLPAITISHDAGKFVCEGLYYEVLNHLEITSSSIPCIFVHVPPLTPKNRSQILEAFLQLLDRI